MYLVFLHKVVHVDAYIVWATPTLCGLLPEVYPSDRSKVSGLSTVQSSIEARVIAIRKGNDEVASFLGHLEWMDTVTNTHKRRRVHLVNRDGVLPEHRWRDDGHLVAKEARTLISTVWEQSYIGTYTITISRTYKCTRSTANEGDTHMYKHVPFASLSSLGPCCGGMEYLHM